MQFTILGSGGSIPTPRPFSNSVISNLARKNEKFKRNSSSFFCSDLNLLIDTPEDIIDSINRQNIGDVDYVLFTHWHPDHCFGMRNIFNSYYNPVEQKVKKVVKIICPKNVYKDIKIHFPSIDFFINQQKTASIQFLEHGEFVTIDGIKITTLGYNGIDSHTVGYLFESESKILLYTPCDTFGLSNIPQNIDVRVTECGIFSYEKVLHELSFPQMIKNIKKYSSKKTILTHIEELELANWGLDYLQEMKHKYSNINFDFGFDGQKITL